MVVGGHHDNTVPDISEDEINQESINEDPAAIAHVAAYNVEAEKKKAEEAAKHVAENPVVEQANLEEIGSNASPVKVFAEASVLEAKTPEIAVEETTKAGEKTSIENKKKGNASCKCSIF